MSAFGDVLAAIEDFRADLFTDQNSVAASSLTPSIAAAGLRGILGQLISPLDNVHATGVGIRMTKGKLFPSDFVIKVYVFQKLNGLGKLIPKILAKPFHGVDIDIEELPIVEITAKKAAKAAAAAAATVPQRLRRRPIVGGLQIQPRGASFVGTLGGFVRPVGTTNGVIFALSNNHVLASTNRSPVGTEIVQPDSSRSDNGFARLSNFEPIQLATPNNQHPPRNRMDAAIARVTDLSLIKTGTMFGIPNYSPQLAAPLPGMKVVKSGRTTGVTTGIIKSIRVNGLKVNYGTLQNPILGTFDGCVGIAGDNGANFGIPGDSGSFILDRISSRAVALLFAAGSRSQANAFSDTFACDLNAVCNRFNVVPV